MRIILFRAKAVSSGELVYGNLIHSKRFAGWSNEWRIHNQETGLESDIDPDTIGQFTGYMDKDGKRVFEGDEVNIRGRYYTVIWDRDGFCLTQKGDKFPLASVFICAEKHPYNPL